jgi:hypothetical protein
MALTALVPPQVASRLLFVISVLGLLASAFSLQRVSQPSIASIPSDDALMSANPDPPHHASSKIPTQSQVYIAVMDTSYSPAPYHCLMKDQWMDEIATRPFIDGVEFYSILPLEHRECIFPMVTVKRSPFPRAVNPSSHLVFQILAMYLKRSFSGWLFLISDAAYVHCETLCAYINASMNRGPPSPFAEGSCVERRFYFQMLSISSGILMTRGTVESLVQNEEMWNVTIETGLPADESLSQILDDVGAIPKAGKRDELLGQPFRNPEFSRNLIERSFDSLEHCEHPDDKSRVSGVAAVCSTAVTQLNRLVVWAGGGRNATEKEWFLRNARIMIENAPDFVHFTWDRLYPQLCRK